MKKLMIALAVAAIAVTSQAATFNWKSGANIQGADASKSGKFDGTTLAANKFTMYVWDNLTKAEYDALDITSDSFYTTWSAKTETAIGGGVKAAVTSLGATAADKSVANDKDYYAAILFTYTDASGNDWYIANKATGHTDATGGGKSITDLAKILVERAVRLSRAGLLLRRSRPLVCLCSSALRVSRSVAVAPNSLKLTRYG